jgi:hypothetical protein
MENIPQVIRIWKRQKLQDSDSRVRRHLSTHQVHAQNFEISTTIKHLLHITSRYKKHISRPLLDHEPWNPRISASKSPQTQSFQSVRTHEIFAKHAIGVPNGIFLHRAKVNSSEIPTITFSGVLENLDACLRLVFVCLQDVESVVSRFGIGGLMGDLFGT